MELLGKIIKKLDISKGTTTRGDWQKQEFIVEYGDKFPKNVCITAWADKVEELKKFEIGSIVKLFLNAESREYNNRWYTDLRFWKIEPQLANAQGANVNSNYSSEPSPEFTDVTNSIENEDLPF